MPKSIKYKGYIVSAEAEQWSNDVWAGSYVITAQSSGKTIREVPDAVIGETFDSACDRALARGRQYLDRISLEELTD